MKLLFHLGEATLNDAMDLLEEHSKPVAPTTKEFNKSQPLPWNAKSLIDQTNKVFKRTRMNVLAPQSLERFAIYGVDQAGNVVQIR